MRRENETALKTGKKKQTGELLKKEKERKREKRMRANDERTDGQTSTRHGGWITRGGAHGTVYFYKMVVNDDIVRS